MMFRIRHYAAFILAITLTGSKPAAADNPIIPGRYADPEAVIFDDRCWIYPTSSSPYDEQPGFDAFSSPDLANWTKHPQVLEARSFTWVRRAMWAPAVIRKDDRYFLFFSANDIQSDDEEGGIGVAVSDHPEGPFKDHIGKPLVDRFHHGAQPIDPFVFKDQDGTCYLIYGGWKRCNIGRLNKDFTGFIPFENGGIFKDITPEKYVEGSVMFFRGNRYYFMWSEGNWKGPSYSVAYAIADSPLGPFKRIGKVLQQDSVIATGTGHHSVIRHP